MHSLQHIQKVIGGHKNRFFAENPLKSMAIFGSFARREQDTKSELDILVEFTDQIGIRFIDLADELEKILQLKVDLVSRKGVKEKYFASSPSDLIYV